MAAGFSIEELHLEERSEGSDSDSASEFLHSEDWEAGEKSHSEDGVLGHVEQATPSSSVSSSRPSAHAASSSSSCSTPMAGADRQQQHAGATDAASDITDLSGSGMATVVLDTSHEQQAAGRVVLATAADASSIPDSRSKQQGKASAAADGSKVRTADSTGAASSVAAAALQVASSKAAPPQHLTLYQLTAEANRNLTGQEKKEKGALSLHVLKWYIGAAGGILVALGVLGVIIIEQASRVLTDTFLGWWAADVFHQGLWFYIGLYAGLGVLYSLLTFVR